MIRSRLEADLTRPVQKYFQRRGYHWQATELQFCEYNIDIYGFSRTRNEAVAVELKIEDWKRAFEQALLYQLCSDLVFVGMPHETIHRVDRARFEHEGIGLLCVWQDDRCRVLLKPRPSLVVSESYRGHSISILEEKRKRANGQC